MQFYSNSVSACLKRVTGCSQEESNALRQPVVIAWSREESLKYFPGIWFCFCIKWLSLERKVWSSQYVQNSCEAQLLLSCIFFYYWRAILTPSFCWIFWFKKITLFKYLAFHKIKSKEVFVTDTLKLVCVFEMHQNFLFSVTVCFLS